MLKEQTFEELVNEWVTRTKEMIARKEEVLEGEDIRGIPFPELTKRGSSR